MAASSDYTIGTTPTSGGSGVRTLHQVNSLPLQELLSKPEVSTPQPYSQSGGGPSTVCVLYFLTVRVYGILFLPAVAVGGWLRAEYIY